MAENEAQQAQEVPAPAIEEAPAQEPVQVAAGQAPQQASPTKGKNKLLIPIIIVAIIAVVAIVALTFLFNPPQKYAFVIDGISYQSNSYAPSEFFREFKQNKVVYVSPNMEDEANPFTANAMNLWLVVLNSEDINTVQLIRVTGASGTLSSCITNRGDVRTNEPISVEECNSLLNDPDNAVVLIENNAAANKAVLSKNRLEVFATGSKEIGAVNFLVIKQMFPDAQDSIDIANQKIYGVNASGGVPASGGSSDTNTPSDNNAPDSSGSLDANVPAGGSQDANVPVDGNAQ